MLKREVASLLGSEAPPKTKLQGVCDFLHRRIGKYNWVGFYCVDIHSEEELFLGPFAGQDTIHKRIHFGDGVCGRAAELIKVMVVDNVGSESNYLSCSPDVNSEFVAPVVWNAKLVGELDIDSNTQAAFSKADIQFLSWVAESAAEALAFASGFRV